MEQNNSFIVSATFLKNLPIRIGLNKNAVFIAQFKNMTTVVINEDSAVNLLELLTIDFNYFSNTVNVLLITQFKELMHLEEEQAASIIFPYRLIVKEALESKRDYWIRTSFQWLSSIGKSTFKAEIEQVLKDKKIGQKVRHELLKL